MQITKSDNGSTTYTTITGQKVIIQAHPDVDPNDTAGSIITAALDHLNALSEAVRAARDNPHLSKVGREAALADIIAKTITGFGALHANVVFFQGSIDKMRTEHLAIPQLGAGLGVDCLLDVEIRAWWKQANADEKQDVLLGAATDAQCARVLVALLRSPVPGVTNAQFTMISESWAAMRDALDPVKAQTIVGQQKAAEWCFASLALIASIVLSLVATWGGRSKFEILKAILDDQNERVNNSAQMFGYSTAEIANAQRNVEVDRMRAKERAGAA